MNRFISSTQETIQLLFISDQLSIVNMGNNRLSKGKEKGESCTVA